jgi:hypothetical protein
MVGNNRDLLIVLSWNLSEKSEGKYRKCLSAFLGFQNISAVTLASDFA